MRSRRKALIVGIDYYAHGPALHGCVNDAYSVKSVFERHSDGTINFSVKLLTGIGPADPVNRIELRNNIKELFEGNGDTESALFYFAGHGHIDITGGYILASDSQTGDDGIALSDIIAFANSPNGIRDKIILLDSCHSGIAGALPANPGHAELSNGLTILTASTADQYAKEEHGAGIFTTLLIDALNGAASNLVGDITPGSVYAHIDQSLGEWQQRPVFKTNVKSFVSLREVQAPISLPDLKRITQLFTEPGYEFPLDPSFEPESENPIYENTENFAILQKYNRVNLVIPIDAPHMYHAAMESKACKLTVLGEHYWKLINNNLL